MTWQDVLIDGYKRIPGSVEHVAKGLKQADLDWRPAKDANSIGWTLWHATRGEDAQISDLMGEKQLWIADGWHKKFDRPADPGDTGFGHKPKQLAAFKSPPASVLIGYQKAVTKRSIKYLKSLKSSDLARELNEPWFQPLPTVGVRLMSILEDSVLHGGEASYIRGLRHGLGWQQY